MQWRLGAVLALCTVVTTVVSAQTMTNNGGTIYLSPRAVMLINGSYSSVANGQLTAEDSASLRITGAMHIRSGRATLNGRAVATVDSNLTTGGIPCTTAYGFLIRNGTGLLTVKGSIVNQGEIQNRSTIVVWRDFINRGSCSNSGLIEVGLP